MHSDKEKADKRQQFSESEPVPPIGWVQNQSADFRGPTVVEGQLQDPMHEVFLNGGRIFLFLTYVKVHSRPFVGTVLCNDHAGADGSLALEIDEDKDILAIFELNVRVLEARSALLDDLAQSRSMGWQIEGVEFLGQFVEIVEIGGPDFA